MNRNFNAFKYLFERVVKFSEDNNASHDFYSAFVISMRASGDFSNAVRSGMFSSFGPDTMDVIDMEDDDIQEYISTFVDTLNLNAENYTWYAARKSKRS